MGKNAPVKRGQKSPLELQDVAFPNKQLLTNNDAEHSQQTQTCYIKKLRQPEFLEPAQCLTFDEISQINTPLEQTLSPRASLRPEPANHTTMIGASSESETAHSPAQSLSVDSFLSSAPGNIYKTSHPCQRAASDTPVILLQVSMKLRVLPPVCLSNGNIF